LKLKTVKPNIENTKENGSKNYFLYLQNHPIIASTGGKKSAIDFFEDILKIYQEGCKPHHFLKNE
jgi:hypothetical protein